MKNLAKIGAAAGFTLIAASIIYIPIYGILEPESFSQWFSCGVAVLGIEPVTSWSSIHIANSFEE